MVVRVEESKKGSSKFTEVIWENWMQSVRKNAKI